MLRYLFIFFVFFITACSDSSENTFQGYIEGEYTYIAPSVSGRLDKLPVHRGEMIKENQTLFILDKTPEKAEFEAAKARLSETESSEQLADTNLKRDQQQYTIGAIPKSQLDNSFYTHKEDVASVLESKHNLTSAAWNLSQTKANAASEAFVHDTLYNLGEWVEAGNPVVILLPPDKLKIRFFVPEPVLSHLKMGAPITIITDSKKFPAKITYISDEAEYTSPLIYSNNTRSKLIFRIEAKPDSPNVATMHPGQPVEVTLHD